MLSDMHLWSTIRHALLVDKISKRAACNRFGLDFRTIQKIVARAYHAIVWTLVDFLYSSGEKTLQSSPIFSRDFRLCVPSLCVPASSILKTPFQSDSSQDCMAILCVQTKTEYALILLLKKLNN